MFRSKKLQVKVKKAEITSTISENGERAIEMIKNLRDIDQLRLEE